MVRVFASVGSLRVKFNVAKYFFYNNRHETTLFLGTQSHLIVLKNPF